jgi:hypothetical protein
MINEAFLNRLKQITDETPKELKDIDSQIIKKLSDKIHKGLEKEMKDQASITEDRFGFITISLDHQEDNEGYEMVERALKSIPRPGNLNLSILKRTRLGEVTIHFQY